MLLQEEWGGEEKRCKRLETGEGKREDDNV